MTPTTATVKLTDEIMKFTIEQAHDRVEELWLEHLSELPTQAAFHTRWVKAMRKAGATDRVEELEALLIEDQLEKERWRPSVRVLLAVIPYYARSETLRPLFVRGLRGFYGEVDQIGLFIDRAGLSNSASLVDGFKQVLEWVRLTPGQVYAHIDWGEGVINRFDLDTGRIRIDFPRQPDKEMTVEGVRKYLRYIEPTHFLARRATEPESLRKLAQTDPTGLIKQALSEQKERQLKQAALKELLVPQVVEATDWNGWWGKTREELKIDPYIDFNASGGASALIHLREQPRSFEAEIEEQFFAPDAGTSIKAELIRQLARRPKGVDLPQELIGRMAADLEQTWDLLGEDHPIGRLEAAYMLEDLAKAAPDAQVPSREAGAILEGFEDYDALVEIDHVDYGIRALAALLERDGHAGCEQAAGLLARAPVKLAQSIWRALDHEHHIDVAVAAVQELLDAPLGNVETYVWMVRAILDGSWAHLEDYFPASGVVVEILDQMEEWHHLLDSPAAPKETKEAAKKLLSRTRTLLGANKCDAISRAVEGMNKDLVRRVRRAIQTHSALQSSLKSQAERIILLTRRDLAEEEQAPAKADEHICTELAYAQKAAELREIKSVRIPKNSKVIELARMEGDLRENAGYQYAKEEQKMLMQTQASLTDLLSRAIVRRAGDIDTRRIGFGIQFRARNLKTEQEENYTILGRWEADAERHVLSMQAPLASQFTNHKAGDSVVIEHPGGGSTPYQVLEIQNALATGQWNAPTKDSEPAGGAE